MNEEQVLELIEEIRPNIEKLSYIFSLKMKQPSLHSTEDLVQEGIETAIHQIRLERLNNEKGKASTYLIRSIITHFIDLMKKSYKTDPTEKPEVLTGLSNRNVVAFKFKELDTVLRIMKTLTTKEKEYLTTILSPPESIKSKISGNRKIARKLIREILNISHQEERFIREELRRKITERT